MRQPRNDQFRAEIDRQSALFRTALTGCDEAARVPACPDWAATDLLAHLTEVQAFWAYIVATPITEGSQLDSYDDPTPADTYAVRLTEFDAAHRSLGTAVGAATPGDARWMWACDQGLHTVGYITRRQAHEALIHRVDAEQAAAQPVTDADPHLAADGVDEMVTVMLGGHPEWASFAGDGRVVRLAATDTGDEWLVELGRLAGTHPRSGEQFEEAGLRPVTGGEPKPIATISAPAWPLDLWLWNRTDAATVERTGDADALRHVDDALTEGLN